ncbi:aminotransferase class III-fold pyridoxal phosphate-dependent enzyme [Bradyrhizobium arachidis]|uniref:aspartate aminotransferase family protein n=1 Tax=Bradyrhizobium arachidis TaxID=858423 RepID=UPI00216317DC|nr:aminotransferase class III-fold pyridoxal phosphate-dependent enzyme [Bradyrhizobium arachidis]UVO35762.1 aminotransferase class III-fold pyridoxal phosphate-dependent enzyme [Bradyrhizobium arachidis]
MRWAANAVDYLAGNCLGIFKLPDEVAFIVARGQGPWVWSSDGRRFADYLMGSGPMVLGHAHPRVVSAIAEQAALGTHFYQVSIRAYELAARVCQSVPCAESVKFCSDGSEANFYALRLARAFTRRTKILKFEGAFHGHSDYAQQSLRTETNRNDQRAMPQSAGIPTEISDTVVIAPFNDIEWTTQIVGAIGHEIAAILVEPVQRALMPAPGFLEGLRVLADSIGALLVFDEVVTGFRLALGGAQEHFRVKPDLCALGKILGGGLPLAAVAGRGDVLELSIPGRPQDGRSVFVSGTLNGNPLGCAAGLATLEVVEELQAPAKLKEKGEALAAGLEEIANRLSVPFQMIGAPCFPQPAFGVGLAGAAQSSAASRAHATLRFGVEMIRRGVLLAPGGKLYMSVSHTDETHGFFLERAEGAIRAVRDQGLLE